MKQATVIIPNWNGMKYLDTCLGSLRAQTVSSFEILMVDNGSSDGSVAFVQKKYPEVKIAALPENTGFCHAVNVGISMSASPYVILLNNDVRCDRNFVKELLRGIKKRPDAFSCQAKMLDMHDPSRIDDAGDFYCALGWAFARGKGRSASRYQRLDKIFSSCAGAAIYRRAAFARTGVFDERHFAYLEDVDLGYRARRKGYENYYLPLAVAEHAGSGASGSRYNDFKVRSASRNGLYVIRKNMPPWQIALNAPLLAAGILIKMAFFAKKGFLRSYVSGLREGLWMNAGRQKQAEEEDFAPKALREDFPLRTCLGIQLQLWANTVRRLFS